MEQLSPGKCFEIAEQSVHQLAAQVDDNGRFLYAYNFSGGELKGYNYLRHCGAVWSMAEISYYIGVGKNVEEAIVRALEWMINNHSLVIDGRRCIVSRNFNAKLGGAGLAMLACLAVFRLNGAERYLRLSMEFSEFALALQRSDGDFIHKLSIRTGEVSSFQSNYYTGEALFGLGQLARFTSDERISDRVRHSINGLSARGYGVREQSHWMLYALKESSRICDLDLVVQYAKNIVNKIIDDPSYRLRRQSTPIACRSEGLLAFLELVAESGCPNLENIRKEAWQTACENLMLQFEFFDKFGVFVKGEKCDKVQIDYIQHNASSFLHAARLMQSESVPV